MEYQQPPPVKPGSTARRKIGDREHIKLANIKKNEMKTEDTKAERFKTTKQKKFLNARELK